MTRMLPSPHDEAFARSNDVAWRRSSRSGTSGACVEVAGVADGVLAVRDSKDPEGGCLAFSAVAWERFMGVLRG
jgi:Domain of unknown function (DUF397)